MAQVLIARILLATIRFAVHRTICLIPPRLPANLTQGGKYSSPGALHWPSRVNGRGKMLSGSVFNALVVLALIAIVPSPIF